MALKKAFCRYCHEGDHLSIFEAIPDADVCFCPSCGRQLIPNTAINDYDQLLVKYTKDAEKILYAKTDYLEAYQSFAHIIEIAPDYFEGYAGRLVSLIYLSTLRRERLRDFITMFESENDMIVKLAKSKETYISFLKKVNFAIDDYDKNFRRRLIYRHHFYDSDCVSLYFTRLSEIIEAKEVIRGPLENFKNAEKNYKGQEDLYKKIVRSLSVLNNQLKEQVICADGFTYKLVSFGKDGSPLLAKEERVTSTNIKFNRSLNPNDKHKKIIKDRVFKDFSHFYSWSKVSLIFIVIAVLIAALGLCSGLFMKNKIPYHWVGYIVFAVALAGAFVLVGFHIAWKKQLKSRRHLID